jgi:hypothetical protein
MLASEDNLTIANKKNIKAFMGYTTKTWVGSVNKTLKDKPSLGKDKLHLCTSEELESGRLLAKIKHAQTIVHKVSNECFT